MIKGRPPYPFETIALAVTFSPSLPLLVSEMRRLCDLHDATSIFIHSGKKTGEKQRDLAGYLNHFGFNDSNSVIYWEQGETVQDILNVCKNVVVDLVILGSNEKSNFGLPAGHVASSMAKRAKCSVLIYSHIPSGGFKKIVINATEHQKTELTLQAGIYFAGKEKASEVIFAEDDSESSYDEGITKRRLTGLKGLESSGTVIQNVHLQNFRSIKDFVFKNDADLVITRSADHPLLIFDRISGTDGIDELISELPSNLLIIHSRLAG